jgi:hypothetical protein
VAFNPLRNEGDAFRVLVYFVAAIALIVIVVIVIRALT